MISSKAIRNRLTAPRGKIEKEKKSEGFLAFPSQARKNR